MEKFTLYIAIYGAFLSTLVFLWDIIKHQKDKPNLRVETNQRVLIGQKSERKIGIDMINEGRRPITIVASGFKLDTKSDENTATVFDPNLPKEINEGQRCTTFVNPETIDTDKILYAWARDATGKVYRSKKQPLKLAK
ncbi:MAG: hypothetical protein AABN34_17485 [Acidobacteriota bacterium]